MKNCPRHARSRRPSATVHAVALLLVLVGCRTQPPDQTAQTKKAPTLPAPSSAVVTTPPDASVAATPADAGPGASGQAPVDEPLGGANFAKEAQAAYRVAACGGDDAFIPASIDRKIVDKHCQVLKNGYAEYKREWLDVAVPFIANLRPASLPTTVVYPFGGGDLVSALATFPDAVELTTISLEVAGDVRGIMKAESRRLDRELGTLRDHLAKLFLKAHSRTINLDIETRGAVPGEVAFTMAALAIHGFEPISFRYFDFNADGTLRWLTEEDIAGFDKTKGGKTPFANAEIRFKKAGETRTRTFRHVAYDLSDGSLKKNPALLRHLDAKVKVAAMTKAASHLLWDDANFGVIRDWLMTHTDWMISDTTGVPPRIAKKYGFTQDLYGQYEWPEPFGTVNNKDAQEFRDLFKGKPPLAFRYGYPDNKSHGHMVVTHK